MTTNEQLWQLYTSVYKMQLDGYSDLDMLRRINKALKCQVKK